MASINKNLTNLTDIPLGLEQGDGIDITAVKDEKIKSNSLKRFFRMTKSSMTTSKSSESDDTVCESEMKNIRSLQLRFGSFHKKDENDKEKSNAEPSSSKEAMKTKPTESRVKLQERMSNYWNTAFKKSLKKSSTNDNPQIEGNVNPPSDDIDKFANNQSANL
ncbi:uncharacterized protein LOC129916671 [Episyrphus balteatus]|uniref:uncharacterized protein LOC129916671 n=1 Tax=Episyrphus balteatus TaxID=286459 RepID=UPI00248554F3|nr:uncharacterized protein LOC129916671 [Episyrphus balteatus]